ncbi:MAG: metal-dependent transcriptional regulator [Candidatus Bathyarchaeia archaeon]
MLVSVSVEDHLEAIYELTRERGQVRVVDISRYLNIKPPSVVEMLWKLKAKGFVIYERNRRVRLTQKGEELAKFVGHKHKTLVNFLILLGIEEDIAEEDACRIEHVIHPATAKKLAEFVKSIQSSPKKRLTRPL